MPAPSQSKAVHQGIAGGLVVDAIEMTFGAGVNARGCMMPNLGSLGIRYPPEAGQAAGPPSRSWRAMALVIALASWLAWPGHDVKGYSDGFP
jgi:hypothetical protein